MPPPLTAAGYIGHVISTNAHAADHGQLVIAGGNHGDMGTVNLGEGQGEQRDTASALDQDAIAGAGVALGGNGAPGGQSRAGQRRGWKR